MLFAVSLGYAVSFVIRESGMILPVAVLAGLTDCWNVVIGPLGRLVERSPDVVAAFAVELPSPVVGARTTMMGMGDFVFLALYFGVLHRFSMNENGAFWLSYALLTASMLAVTKWGLAVPALVPLSIGVLLPNARNIRLSRQEWFAVLYTLATASILLIGLTVYMLHR